MPDERIILNLDLPTGVSLPVALNAIAFDIEDNDEDSGYARTEGGDVSWRTRRPGEGVELDPRQRAAAAALLLAFDLPVDMTTAAKTMLEAADMHPGLKVETMGRGNRRAMLEKARGMIDEMLADL